MITIYIILGATGSGRREIAFDLIEHIGENGKGRAIVLLAENEKPSPYDEQIQALHEVTSIAWHFSSDREIIANHLPEEGETLFFITNGRLNPVDQIEALSAWISKNDLRVARTLSVINCKLCEKESALNTWYEACIHFSDVVLLNKRESVPNNWVRDFIRHFEKKHYPCLFEFVKKGRVSNPAQILYPEPRRLSHIFEDEDSENANTHPEFTIEEDIVHEDDEPIEDDPYLKRLSDGRRARIIPDICDYLE
jgi:hypothetical protein